VLVTDDRRQREDAEEEAVDEITRQPSLAERDVLVAGTLADLVAVRTKGWQKTEDDELIGDESIADDPGDSVSNPRILAHAGELGLLAGQGSALLHQLLECIPVCRAGGSDACAQARARTAATTVFI